MAVASSETRVPTTPSFRLDGKRALVTGASRWLGRAIAIVYAICLASPNITLANALSALVFTLFSNFAGFLITRDNIPGWWIWAHYIDLDMYGIEALLINEVVRLLPLSPSLPLLTHIFALMYRSRAFAGINDRIFDRPKKRNEKRRSGKGIGLLSRN